MNKIDFWITTFGRLAEWVAFLHAVVIATVIMCRATQSAPPGSALGAIEMVNRLKSAFTSHLDT